MSAIPTSVVFTTPAIALATDPIVTVDAPLVPVPPQKTTAQLFALVDTIDNAMWNASRTKGPINFTRPLAQKMTSPGVVGVSLAAVSAVGLATAIGMSGAPDAAQGIFPGLFFGGIGGGAVGGVGTAWLGSIYDRFCRSKVVPREATQKLTDVFTNGSLEEKHLAGFMAEVWTKRFDTKKVSGEAVRLDLKRLVDAKQRLDANGTQEARAVARDVSTVAAHLRGTYGEPLSTLTESGARDLRLAIVNCGQERRLEIAKFVLDKLFRGEKPRVHIQASTFAGSEAASLLRTLLELSTPQLALPAA